MARAIHSQKWKQVHCVGRDCVILPHIFHNMIIEDERGEDPTMKKFWANAPI